MKRISLELAIAGTALAGLFTGCSKDDTNTDAGVADTGVTDSGTTPDAGTPDSGTTPDSGVFSCPAWAGTQPAGTVAINFSIDDSANKTYGATDGLAWKGSMNYDSATRCITRDTSWGGGTGPYATLFDDGPWNAGGHEPAGSTAGDNKWGVTVFLKIPTAAEGDQAFEYGAVRNWSAGNQGDWIWQGPNGTFTVTAGSTDPVTATGLTIAAFGTTDLKLVLEIAALDPAFAAFDPMNGVKVKSSGWGWSELDCVDDGTKGDDTAADGKFTFMLSAYAGMGNLKHAGLLKSGDEAQFVFVLGGVEYKVAGAPPTAGVKAYTKPDGGAFAEVAVSNKPDGDKNTFVTVP